MTTTTANSRAKRRSNSREQSLKNSVPKPTEADLARYIVGYFQNLQWEVYQEVQLSTQGSRADIVVTQGKLVGICECKQSLGLPVLEQAYEWKPYAHFVWVATWYKSRTG